MPSGHGPIEVRREPHTSTSERQPSMPSGHGPIEVGHAKPDD